MNTKAAGAVLAARKLVNLILTDEPPNTELLIAALDRMLAAYHDTTELPTRAIDDEPPRASYQERYKTIGARFPDYGWYSVASPLELPSKPLTGDAIDDLTDICADLEAVVWSADTHGLEAAIWQLDVFYYHWGNHARELLTYLFARQFAHRS